MLACQLVPDPDWHEHRVWTQSIQSIRVSPLFAPLIRGTERWSGVDVLCCAVLVRNIGDKLMNASVNTVWITATLC